MLGVGVGVAVVAAPVEVEGVTAGAGTIGGNGASLAPLCIEFGVSDKPGVLEGDDAAAVDVLCGKLEG